MFKIGDKVKVRLVDDKRCAIKLRERDGQRGTVIYIGGYNTAADDLYIEVEFQGGRVSYTHAMNLVPVSTCPMEVQHDAKDWR